MFHVKHSNLIYMLFHIECYKDWAYTDISKMFHVKHLGSYMDSRCLDYLDRILVLNKSINVTNIKDREQGILLHLEDSLTMLPEIEQAPPGKYGDLGSGGGFPGVPIAIETGRQTLLIDSVQKKMKAVQCILDDMNLSSSISTCSMRIEELGSQQPETFAVLSARALSKLPSLLELASPLLVQGGQLICLKAHIEEEELHAALSIEKQTGMHLHTRRNFFLSDNETYREVITFQKTGNPSLTLPRRVGLAQKKPLN